MVRRRREFRGQMAVRADGVRVVLAFRSLPLCESWQSLHVTPAAYILLCEERAPLVDLVQDLAVGVIELRVEQRGAVGVEERLVELRFFAHDAAPRVARRAGLDLDVRCQRRIPLRDPGLRVHHPARADRGGGDRRPDRFDEARRSPVARYAHPHEPRRSPAARYAGGAAGVLGWWLRSRPDGSRRSPLARYAGGAAGELGGGFGCVPMNLAARLWLATRETGGALWSCG